MDDRNTKGKHCVWAIVEITQLKARNLDHGIEIGLLSPDLRAF